MESSNNTYFVVKFSIGLWDKSKWCKLMSLSNTPFGTVLMLLWLKEREVKESRPSKAPLCTFWILLNDSIMATKLLNASKAWGSTSVIVWLWRSNPRIEDDSFIKSGHLYWKSKGMESMVCSWQETMSLFNSHGQSIFDDRTTIGSEVQNAKMKKKLCNSILLLIPMTTSKVTSKISTFSKAERGRPKADRAKRL